MKKLICLLMVLGVVGCSSKPEPVESDGCVPLVEQITAETHSEQIVRLSYQAANSLRVVTRKSYVSLDKTRVDRLPVTVTMSAEEDYLASWLSGFYADRKMEVSASCNNTVRGNLLYVSLAVVDDKYRVVSYNADKEVLFVIEEPVN